MLALKIKKSSKITKGFTGLTAKTYSYLIYDSSKDKKSKDTKMCVTKRKPKFQNYENSLKAAQLKNKKQTIYKNMRLTRHNYINPREPLIPRFSDARNPRIQVPICPRDARNPQTHTTLTI